MAEGSLGNRRLGWDAGTKGEGDRENRAELLKQFDALFSDDKEKVVEPSSIFERIPSVLPQTPIQGRALSGEEKTPDEADLKNHHGKKPRLVKPGKKFQMYNVTSHCAGECTGCGTIFSNGNGEFVACQPSHLKGATVKFTRRAPKERLACCQHRPEEDLVTVWIGSKGGKIKKVFGRSQAVKIKPEPRTVTVRLHPSGEKKPINLARLEGKRCAECDREINPKTRGIWMTAKGKFLHPLCGDTIRDWRIISVYGQDRTEKVLVNGKCCTKCRMSLPQDGRQICFLDGKPDELYHKHCAAIVNSARGQS